MQAHKKHTGGCWLDKILKVQGAYGERGNLLKIFVFFSNQKPVFHYNIHEHIKTDFVNIF